MSCFFNSPCETTINIPTFAETNGVIYYDIKVGVKDIFWQVQPRRYREFHDLNEKLVCEESIAKTLLPPKKVIGNKTKPFLEQRRKQLEDYLNQLLVLLRVKMPRPFVEFLDFNKYDIVYILQDLAQFFAVNGDSIISESKEYNFTALELFAISERMRLPCPTAEIVEKNFNFSHVLDFCNQLEVINIIPTKASSDVKRDYNSVDVPIERSSLIPKNLKFHLYAFRNLKVLRIYGISTENLIDVSNLKSTLKSICVHNTTTTKINQILMCDNIHKNETYDNSVSWDSVEQLNISGNLLSTIDPSIKLLPYLKTLIMDQNRLQNIANLNFLSQLHTLSIAENIIEECIDWHMELGNLVTLNLAQNKLKNLSGLKKMYSLVNLDLSCNLIDDMSQIDYISGLPLLENLRLTGNPIAGSVDYRARVLARFHDRAGDIVLDNEKGSTAELDTALVLSALDQSNKHFSR